MTVYIDDAQIKAKVGRIEGIWSHLFADSKEELHAFAISKLGLKRSWFQDKSHGLWHYDVTEPKRQLAIQCGAQQVNWRDAPKLMRERDQRQAFTIDHEKLDKVYEGYAADPAFEHLRTGKIPFIGGEGDRPIAMVIGEAPGAIECAKSRPFVGPAGIVLRQLMAVAGLKAAPAHVFRDGPSNCWLTNVVKYRPLRNRTPSIEEIRDSRPYLRAEWVAIGSPDIIITVGATALTAVTGRQQSIMAKAGQMWSHYDSEREPSTMVFWPMLHPAFGLRNEHVRPVMEQHWLRLGEWLANHSRLNSR